MPDGKNISRRDFLRISLGGALALSLGKYALFSDENVKADFVLYGAEGVAKKRDVGKIKVCSKWKK